MSGKKPEVIHVNGSFDHRIHHAYIDDELKSMLVAHGFRLDQSFYENDRYYAIVAERLPDQGFEPALQKIMDDPEMPATLTFRYAYTNPMRTAAGYGGGYCKITRKSVEWLDTDCIPIIFDALRTVSRETHLSDRSKRALNKAFTGAQYPVELAALSNRITVMGMSMQA
jgi:hypothetical protein